MNIRTFILSLAGGCLLATGCGREATIPGDSFRLSVQSVMNESDTIVSLLKIRVRRDASISVDGDGFHSMVVLSDSPTAATKDGQVALSASRIAQPGDGQASVQTCIRVEANGGSAGGPAVQAVPATTKLETYLTVSAAAGDYKLNAPVEIARLNGKPVMLVVGKPAN